MTRFMTMLAAVGLMALTPIASNHVTISSLDYVKIAAHRAMSGPLPEVQHVSARFDAPTAQLLMAQAILQNDAPVVQSAPSNQRYPDSLGG
jgi:hypothetical protein